MALELPGPGEGLLDDGVLVRARGAGPDAKLVWRARLRDDEGRVWRAEARSPEDLVAAWSPAKASAGPVAALQSLRPVRIDVRVETPEGRTAARTITSLLADPGVRLRRWRDGLTATLHLPAEPAPAAVAVLDATAGGDDAAVLAGPLLASRGVLVLTVTKGDVALAAERLAAVAAAGDAMPQMLTEIPLAPGVPATHEDPAARAAAWDALLRRLGARARSG